MIFLYTFFKFYKDVLILRVMIIFSMYEEKGIKS